jgi:hypothetical protein
VVEGYAARFAIFAIVARLRPVTFSGALARWRGANAKRADGRYAADLLFATAGLAGPVPLRLHDSKIECQLMLFPRSWCRECDRSRRHFSSVA